MSWFDLVKMLVPIIVGAKVPHGQELAPVIARAIEGAESIKDAKGKDKLAAVVSETNTAVDAINAAYGTEKINKAAVNAVLGNTVSMVITGANTVTKAKTVVNSSVTK